MKVLTGGQRWLRRLRRWTADPQIRFWLLVAGSFAGGFCLSAAALGHYLQPFSLGVLCAGLPGWLPLPFALGSSLGYWLFWGQSGLQGVVWMAAGLPVCLLAARDEQKIPPLMPGLAALIVAVCGVIFQLWQGAHTPVAMYLLRIGLAFGAAWLTQLVLRRRDATADWLAVGVAVLALAQIAPVPFLNLGYLLAGFLAVAAPFPAVAVTGMALDLSSTAPVPMTAVLCLAYGIRMIPRIPAAARCLLPSAVYAGAMALWGEMQWMPVPALLVGGLCSALYRVPQGIGRRGKTGFVQLRLELVSAVLAQTEQLLQESGFYPLDEGALMARAADRACGECAYRQECRDAIRIPYLPQSMLHQQMIVPENIPADCRQKGRLLLELQRSQDQYRMLRADRDRQQEYRTAVTQQYRFLSEYLRDLSDNLSRQEEGPVARFRPEVSVCSRGKEAANGDKCVWFAGTENRYYLLLCDGMGTGEGAAFEAKTAVNMLRRMLVAGYPARYALRSLNSLCVLRGSAGAVTVDLAEADLQTGRATLYKWGAAPSWLLSETGPERIGRESPPPGLSVEETQETVDRFSLQQGAPLVLLSDGVDGSSAMGALEGDYDQPAGFLAALILEEGQLELPDDATAAVMRLHRLDRR